jgi:mono/diheme cytochrome c family protein
VLSQAGYFSGPVPSAHTLPVYAKAGDTNASLEFRVRSYLAINCVQCHQPGGVAPSSWDARPYLTLEQTHLINSTLQDDGGNPANKVVVPGDLAHSVLWQRLHGTNSFGRMPPLATHQLDQTAIQLVASWINTELPARQTFAQWQVAWFGSTNNPQAAPGADPDLDGANNRYEFLTMTSPLTNSPLWKIQLTQSGTNVNVNFLRLANRGFLVENSLDFINWSPWAVPGNQIYFGASNVWLSISGPILPTNQFLRVQIFEP